MSKGELIMSESTELAPLRTSLVQHSAKALVALSHPYEDELPTGFERWRSELESLQGMKLLDAMLTPINAQACIQSLPVEDLHRHIFAIGLDDAGQLLTLASGEQIKALLDIEIWQDHLPNLARLDHWLNTLKRADGEIMYQRMQEMDDELLAWVMKCNATAFVVEDPESFSPPDIDHFLSPQKDFCVVFHRDTVEDAPSRLFVDLFMQEDPQLCITFLLGASSALRSNLEEEAYRWRASRMADLGFIERSEALKIYAAPPHDWRRTLNPTRINEVPPARYWLAQVIAPDARLDAAFACLGWEEAMTVMEHLGYVANMMMSADRIELWDQNAQKETLKRLRAALHISLELLNGSEADAQRDAHILAEHYLSNLFKLGYEQMVEAARPIWRIEKFLKRGSDLSGALLDLPQLKLLADALLGPHPKGVTEESLQTLSACHLAREGALLIEDLVRVSQQLRASDRTEMHNSELDPLDDLRELSLGAEILTAYIRSRLALNEVGPLPSNRLFEALDPLLSVTHEDKIHLDLITWWQKQGGITSTAPLVILRELKEQIGTQNLKNLDPRFVPLLWVEGIEHLTLPRSKTIPVKV